jgi:hypothetical protein
MKVSGQFYATAPYPRYLFNSDRMEKRKFIGLGKGMETWIVQPVVQSLNSLCTLQSTLCKLAVKRQYFRNSLTHQASQFISVD